MLQQVNLFDPSLRPPKRWLTAVNLFALLIVQLLVLGMVYGQERMALQQARQDLIALQIKEAMQKKKNVETLVLYPPKKFDAVLSQTVELTRAKVELHSRLLKKLSETTQGTRGKGFSSHMEGFSRQHESGLWLERFELSQGGATLSMEGGVTKHQLLPRFLEKLGREKAFNGKTFKTFSMSRLEAGMEKEAGQEGIRFQVHTDWLPEKEETVSTEQGSHGKASEKNR